MHDVDNGVDGPNCPPQSGISRNTVPDRDVTGKAAIDDR
jgi:hypothetical protein